MQLYGVNITERCRDTIHQLQVGQLGTVKVRWNEGKLKKRLVATHNTTKGTAPAVGPIHSMNVNQNDHSVLTMV